MTDTGYWTAPRLAGLVLLLGSLIPMIPTIGVAIWGDIFAAEGMFREIERAAGHVTSFKIISITWAVWVLISLGGFVMLGSALWDTGPRTIIALSVVSFAVFVTLVVLEASFHFGVSAWAITKLDAGEPLPEIYGQLKRWLNFYMQILVNPLAMLSFVGFGVAILRTGVLWSWAGWFLIIWGGVFAFFPLPLLIAPIPMLLGIALLIGG